jgi:putative transposase
MDGKGRCHDNIFVERLWRSVKYEEVYLKDYASGQEAYQSLSSYFDFYNYRRPHQSLGYQTPAEIQFGGKRSACELDPFVLGPTLFGRPFAAMEVM